MSATWAGVMTGLPGLVFIIRIGWHTASVRIAVRLVPPSRSLGLTPHHMLPAPLRGSRTEVDSRMPLIYCWLL